MALLPICVAGSTGWPEILATAAVRPMKRLGVPRGEGGAVSQMDYIWICYAILIKQSEAVLGRKRMPALP